MNKILDIINRIRFRFGMLDKEDMHSFWKSPTSDNAPDTYLGHEERSRYLVGLVAEAGIWKEAPILEIGCNIGRNLNALHNAGYTNLTGIDISKEALRKMEIYWPGIAKKIEGNAADVYPQEKFSLVFTMAVLEHIHPDDEKLFSMMAESADTIITIENEHKATWRQFARNYNDVFTKLGFTEVKHEKAEGFEGDIEYTARVFKRDKAPMP